MRVTRVYTEQALSNGGEITLAPMASAHLIKVLRLRAGQQTVLFNGDGHDYLAHILTPKPEACQVMVESSCPVNNESACRITLLQGLCRGEKMDWVLEKCTELGVHKIIPVQCERSEVYLEPERAAKRREHWQRVVISACEQSGRAYVPQVEGLKPLDQRLVEFAQSALESKAAAELRFALHPASQSHQTVGLGAARSIVLAVGPEGGFSERDLSQLALGGFDLLQLGPRVLRTETAGPAALAVMQALAGDFFRG